LSHHFPSPEPLIHLHLRAHHRREDPGRQPLPVVRCSSSPSEHLLRVSSSSFVACAIRTKNPTPRSTQPRPQHPPWRAPVIPTAPHRRTTSTQPRRRHRAAGELRTVLLLLPVQSVSQTVPRSLEPPSPVMPRRAPKPAPPGAAAHRLARLLPFLLLPIKAHQDLLSTPRPSLPHLPHHSAAAAERRRHRPSPPLGHRLRCFPLPSDPWTSFPVSCSSSPCLCF
jgi:hypothetical protein